MTDQKWKGKTAYPKDVATIRQMNRVQDRLDRRVDAIGEKATRFKAEVSDLRERVKQLEAEVAFLHEVTRKEIQS